MGVVFKAEHRRLRRQVAIKVLPIHQTTSSAPADRFFTEMRAIANLQHPNIVLTALDAGGDREREWLHAVLMIA